MSSSAGVKGGTYADRPATPLGQTTGITSAPTSEHPSRKNTPPPTSNPYHYQPAIAATRPELSVLRRNSSNYAQAHAESLTKLTQPDQSEDQSPERSSRRSYSFSHEDHKRSHYQHLMKGDEHDEEEEKARQPLKSPGIGNSEVKGREFGFTSAG